MNEKSNKAHQRHSTPQGNGWLPPDDDPSDDDPPDEETADPEDAEPPLDWRTLSAPASCHIHLLCALDHAHLPSGADDAAEEEELSPNAAENEEPPTEPKEPPEEPPEDP